jgi:hypothetical protein
MKEKSVRSDKRRLARECAKLDPVFEQRLADEGLIMSIVQSEHPKT